MSWKFTRQINLYELHLTYNKKPKPLKGWKSSSIVNDPLLGRGEKHYLTSYSKSYNNGLIKLVRAAKERPDNLLRIKMEHIVYDKRNEKGLI